jgi:hypothetical protein
MKRNQLQENGIYVWIAATTVGKKGKTHRVVDLGEVG